MKPKRTLIDWLAEYSIWGFAFGYFACYVPYSLMVKLLSKGLLPSLDRKSPAGFALLPLSVSASAVGMVIFLLATRWWKHAAHSRIMGVDIPRPTRWTFLSGLCTAMIIGTTTLAYTFEGVSIVFAMLLMRGGVLIIAPIVDALSKRHVRWFSWAGLICALCALLVSLVDTDSYTIPFLCAIDIAIYLASYFIRLRFMSRLAKSSATHANRKYFAEEQMVAAPALVIILAVIATVGSGEIAETIRAGFTAHWGTPYLAAIIWVGIFSQGTGIFGSLVFLDRRENTFCVPVNRSSSIIAGVIATLALTIFFGQHAPRATQFIGAAIIVVAVLFLSIPPALAKRRARSSETV